MDKMDSMETGTHSRHGSGSVMNMLGKMEQSSGAPIGEFSTLQKEIEDLKEYIAAQDRMKKKPNKVIVFLTNVYDRLFHYWIIMKGHFGQFTAHFPVKLIFGFICFIGSIYLLINREKIPSWIENADNFLRKQVQQKSVPHYDNSIFVYNGYQYRTLRPNVEVNSFDNKYLATGRSVLTCPVRFPVPAGWTLVPEAEIEDVITNVVSNHYWSSSAMILNKYAAYPTLSLRSQVARPYPQATQEAKSLPELVGGDPFAGQGPWFEVANIGGQEWVQQNLLPVNTRECLMIVFSFASRGYRDDHVEDVVPACELCSANILIRTRAEYEE
jgi:hypothetical protein